MVTAAKTMAEVLEAHRIDHRHDTALHESCVCGRRWMVGRLKFETHQAAMLTAAGFGLVVDAKAEALEEAAEEIRRERPILTGPWLTARAAALRGQG